MRLIRLFCAYFFYDNENKMSNETVGSSSVPPSPLWIKKKKTPPKRKQEKQKCREIENVCRMAKLFARAKKINWIKTFSVETLKNRRDRSVKTKQSRSMTVSNTIHSEHAGLINTGSFSDLVYILD